MAHFAKIEDGIVTNVIVAEQDFIDEYHSGETWIQTSYNTRCGIYYEANSNTEHSDQSLALRGNFAGIGMIYDSVNDKFYVSQPYASWKLNKTSWLWEAPIADPYNGQDYYWNEDAYQTDNTTGWVEYDR